MPTKPKKVRNKKPASVFDQIGLESPIVAGLCVCFSGLGPGDTEFVCRTPWMIADLTTGTLLLRRPHFYEDPNRDDADEGMQEILYLRHDHPALFRRDDGRAVVDHRCPAPNTHAVPVRYSGQVCHEYFTKHCPPPARSAS